MTLNLGRTELIHRWKAMLNQLRSNSAESRAISDWRNSLQAKVLSFLIKRCEEDPLWGQSSETPKEIPASTRRMKTIPQESGIEKASSPRVRKQEEEIGSTLQSIQAANVSSYLDFGISKAFK